MRLKYAVQTFVHFALFVLALAGIFWLGFALKGPENLRPPGADEPQISMKGVNRDSVKRGSLILETDK